MKTFDVQSIGIETSAETTFAFVSDPANLPKWTNAFKSADSRTAQLETPNGTVPIALETTVRRELGTIDWKMTFPDGTIGTAFSRVTPDGEDRSVYSFVLMAPPVPLEMLEGALSDQMAILAGELVTLKSRLEA